jgi:RNA polymerase sigma factor (sigma-70 family)
MKAPSTPVPPLPGVAGNSSIGSRDVVSWSDAQLIAAVGCDPPDEVALEVLVARYWGCTFARCQMLTLNREKAFDLAQEAWCRVLQHRHALKGDGNFPAYLSMIATNIFRDSYRAARRAGPIGDLQLLSLDVPMAGGEGEMVFLVNVLPDFKSLQCDELVRLKLDIDAALSRLTPLLRAVLLARFIDGYSCAEIGLHHGRTEQTVSGWIRKALQLMKAHLQISEPTSNGPRRQPCCDVLKRETEIAAKMQSNAATKNHLKGR